MNENESIRRVVKQNTELTLREFDRLYEEARQREAVISMQKSRIETLEVGDPDYKAHAQRERVRARQDGFVLDYTIQFAIVGWIVALIAIGYGVWVG